MLDSLMKDINENSLVKDIMEICTKATNVQEIGGKTFSASPLYKVDTKDRTETLPFSDLSSIVPIIRNELKNFDLPLYVVVNDYNEVLVYTSIDDERDREHPYRVKYDGQPFRFGSWCTFEEFVIALRSKFVLNDDVKELLSFLKCVTNSESVKTEDDGISQKVATVKGTSGYQETAPIRRLSPFRTFSEIEQPTSEFLFRISENGGLFALHEADGGAWRKQAKDSIKAYYEEAFADEIKGGKVIVLS